MTNEERQRAASAVLSIPFFNTLMDEIEQAAVNACIFAKYDDHEARQAHAAEARSLKSIRSRLAAISQEGQAPVSRKAPA